MTDTTNPKIEVRENAFLRGEDIPILIDRDGSALEAKPVSALCRCGQSANKPYCDGSHKRAGFDGAGPATPPSDKVYTYEGTDIDVHYAKLLCSHAAECGKRLSAVFDTSQKPWVQPDKGSVDDIKAVVAACPSGALRYALKGGAPEHLTPNEASVTVEANGPYRVANIPLEGVEASPNQSTAKYVLCRCGLSGNKPYCDGSHRDAKWRDD